MKTAAAPWPACFGKLPSRPDFIRGGADHLIGWLDRWLGAAVERAVANAHWKPLYDAAPPLHFAVLDAESPAAVCGHLRPSADSAGRRFPFVVALAVETAAPRLRVARAPLVFARAWRRCADAARRIEDRAGAAGPTQLADDLAGAALPAPTDYDAVSADFEASETLSTLDRRITGTLPEGEAARALLGLGAVLRTLADPNGVAPAGVSLPLPADPALQAMAGAWWTSLIAGPAAAARRELLLLRPLADPAYPPRLLVGFDGASPPALAAAWDPAQARRCFVDAATAQSAAAARDPATRRLASTLAHADSSLALAAGLWREAFAPESR